MISLDDEAALRSADRSGLLDAYATLPAQLREGHRLGRSVDKMTNGFGAVVLCGVGGSAASSDLIASQARWWSGHLPVLVVRGERLPAFTDDRTLVVCVSYSGNTAETLRAAEAARGAGAILITISAGGRLAAVPAAARVLLPASAPVPRAGLGLMVGAILGVLEVAAAVTEPATSEDPSTTELEALVSSLGPSTPLGQNAAKAIATWIGDRIPVIWASLPEAEPVALRWKTAFNENAKMPAFCSSLPELGHNEIVGWTKEWGDRFAVIVLRASWDEDSDPQVRESLAILGEAGIDNRDVRIPQAPVLSELLGLSVVGDFASAYHALMRGIDPAPVEAIDRLKARLR